MERGNTREAFLLKDELFRIDTFQFRYRNNLARYYLKTDRNELAAGEIEFLIQHDPKNPDILSTKVLYLEKNGKISEAINLCWEILAIRPDDKFAKIQLKILF